MDSPLPYPPILPMVPLPWFRFLPEYSMFCLRVKLHTTLWVKIAKTCVHMIIILSLRFLKDFMKAVYLQLRTNSILHEVVCLS